MGAGHKLVFSDFLIHNYNFLYFKNNLKLNFLIMENFISNDNFRKRAQKCIKISFNRTLLAN